MNGYFQLVTNEMGTSIELYPPTQGGQGVDFNELVAYIQGRKIEPIDVIQLNVAVAAAREKQTLFLLTDKMIMAEHEQYVINVSMDKLSVTARFYPPMKGGKEVDLDSFISDLTLKKICHGIQMEELKEFFKNKQYCTDIVVARGTLPKHGKDAVIEYKFNTDLGAKPKTLEDGSVDFHNLNTINHCKEGQLLAVLQKAVDSIPGSDVFNNPLRGRDVKKLHLKHGRNIRLSEDGTQMYSCINGHVSLVGTDVFVSDVFQVENVGTATGNIESEGSVLVTGNVQTGFSVRAKGNIEVRGFVEGAILESGGNIIIGRGVNGMGVGSVSAKGSIVAKFFENARASAGEYIETESILHSHVSAKTEIIVGGKRGLIVGGVVRAMEQISCKTLGTSMGSNTVIEVGIDPQIKERFQLLQKQIADNQNSLKKIQLLIAGFSDKIKKGVQLSPEHVKYLQDLIATEKQMRAGIEKDHDEYLKLDDIMHRNVSAAIIVKDEVFSGTKVIIGNASAVLNNGMKFCKLVNDRGDVKMISL